MLRHAALKRPIPTRSGHWLATIRRSPCIADTVPPTTAFPSALGLIRRSAKQLRGVPMNPVIAFLGQSSGTNRGRVPARSPRITEQVPRTRFQPMVDASTAEQALRFLVAHRLTPSQAYAPSAAIRPTFTTTARQPAQIHARLIHRWRLGSY